MFEENDMDVNSKMNKHIRRKAMKKYLFILMSTLLILTACGQESEEESDQRVEESSSQQEESSSQQEESSAQQEESSAQQEESTETEDTIVVEMDHEVINEDGVIYIKGETNLPDGADLQFTIRKDDFTAQENQLVKNGEFTSEAFSNNGRTLEPGTYELTISLPLATRQDKQFVDKVGDDFEYLEGELMTESKYGRYMKYDASFDINP